MRARVTRPAGAYSLVLPVIGRPDFSRAPGTSGFLSARTLGEPTPRNSRTGDCTPGPGSYRVGPAPIGSDKPGAAAAFKAKGHESLAPASCCDDAPPAHRPRPGSSPTPLDQQDSSQQQPWSWQQEPSSADAAGGAAAAPATPLPGGRPATTGATRPLLRLNGAPGRAAADDGRGAPAACASMAAMSAGISSRMRAAVFGQEGCGRPASSAGRRTWQDQRGSDVPGPGAYDMQVRPDLAELQLGPAPALDDRQRPPPVPGTRCTAGRRFLTPQP
jgi:hypothetical protein